MTAGAWTQVTQFLHVVKSCGHPSHGACCIHCGTWETYLHSQLCPVLVAKATVRTSADPPKMNGVLSHDYSDTWKRRGEKATSADRCSECGALGVSLHSATCPTLRWSHENRPGLPKAYSVCLIDCGCNGRDPGHTSTDGR